MTRYLSLPIVPYGETSQGPDWIEEEISAMQLLIEQYCGGAPSGAEFEVLRFHNNPPLSVLKVNMLDPEAVSYMMEVEECLEKRQQWSTLALRALGDLYQQL